MRKTVAQQVAEGIAAGLAQINAAPATAAPAQPFSLTRTVAPVAPAVLAPKLRTWHFVAKDGKVDVRTDSKGRQYLALNSRHADGSAGQGAMLYCDLYEQLKSGKL